MRIRIQTSRFLPQNGATAEFHVMVTVTDPSLGFDAQLEAVMQACREASEGRTVLFRRFFLSDAANQAPRLLEALSALPPAPTSLVGQAPLDGTRIALWMYCTSPMERKGGVPVHNGYTHHWAGSLVGPGSDSNAQMSAIFQQLDRALKQEGHSVAGDTLRTWIFVRDVDANYAGVVEGRKAYFDRIGLTADTHYIASTGIEGYTAAAQELVEMDACTVTGLQEGQVRYLHAPDYLNRTSDYGVTFERGTAVTYGDRRHLFISGTASIDAQGNVLHPGNAAAQTRRALENIAALLSDADASLSDLAQAIVYLRDPADYPAVRPIVESTCPTLNAVYVHAPVCRPAWLVEIEGIAVTTDGNPAFRPF